MLSFQIVQPHEAEEVRARIKSAIMISKSGCWIWQHSKKIKFGYGQISIHDKSRFVHRVSYEAFKGPIPTNKKVLHSCDNPSCANPDHLFIGTQRDNVLDGISKGRMSSPPIHFGVDNSNATLTDDQVRQLIGLRSVMPQRAVAKIFGCSQSTVWRLFNRKTRLKATESL